MTGWICPVCGAGLAPTTTKCPCVQTIPANPYVPYYPVYPSYPYYPTYPIYPQVWY